MLVLSHESREVLGSASRLTYGLRLLDSSFLRCIGSFFVAELAIFRVEGANERGQAYDSEFPAIDPSQRFQNSALLTGRGGRATRQVFRIAPLKLLELPCINASVINFDRGLYHAMGRLQCDS